MSLFMNYDFQKYGKRVCLIYSERSELASRFKPTGNPMRTLDTFTANPFNCRDSSLDLANHVRPVYDHFTPMDLIDVNSMAANFDEKNR